MTPATYNINIPQNASFSMTFQFKGSDGVPLDLTDYTISADIWTANKRQKLADFTTEWIDRTLGKFSINLTAEQTALVSMVGYWDLLVINPAGEKDYWLRGKTALAVGYTTI